MSRYLYYSVLQTTQQVRKMATANFLFVLVNIIGLPVFLYNFLTNLDNIKGWISFLIGVAYGIYMLDFRRKRNKQILRKHEYELHEMEREKRRKDFEDVVTERINQKK